MLRESVADYLASLCFVHGMQSEHILKVLLPKADLTLDKALEPQNDVRGNVNKD